MEHTIRRLPDRLRGTGAGRDVRRLLGRAFADDPVWSWLVRGRNSADRAGQVLFDYCAAQTRRTGQVWTTEHGEAVATWVPPGAPPTRTSDMLRLLPRVVRPLGVGGLRRLAPLSETDRHHPHQPHWYLSVLGTDPDHQGRGFGGALVTPFTDRADDEGVGCYLESSKEVNVPFYRRFGFEVTEVLHVDRGRGPHLWLMWRDPR